MPGIISLGPLVMATDRFAAVVGICVFLLIASVLAEYREPRLGPWATAVFVLGFVSARVGHVIENAASFWQDPLRVFAFWQGGFSFAWAVPVLAVLTFFRLRRSSARLWALVPVAVGLLAWTLTDQLGTATVTPAGGYPPLPEVTMRQLDGPPLNLAASGGRPRVVNLWATWCPPCRREMPRLAEAARKTPAVDFLFVNQGEDATKIAAYLTREHLSIDHVVLDSASQMMRDFGMSGIPATLFFGSDGHLRQLHVGEISPELLASYLASIIKGAPI